MTGRLLLCCSRVSASPTVKPSRMADGRWRRLLEVDVLGLAGGAGDAGGAPCVRVHSSRHWCSAENKWDLYQSVRAQMDGINTTIPSLPVVRCYDT